MKAISSASAAAALLGRLGGLSTSPAKQAASRRNGCLGGRPRKVLKPLVSYERSESKAGLTSKRPRRGRFHQSKKK